MRLLLWVMMAGIWSILLGRVVYSVGYHKCMRDSALAEQEVLRRKMLNQSLEKASEALLESRKVPAMPAPNVSDMFERKGVKW
jgi:hypothetical protein